jgi:integrase/recombinase XerD
MNSRSQIQTISPSNLIISDANLIHSHISNFLSGLDCSELTRLHYRKRLKQFFLWLNRQQRGQIQRQTIIEYKKWLRDQKYEVSTIGSYLVSVRQFFQWCDIQEIHPDVTKGIKGVKRPRGHRKDALTISQIHGLLDSIDRTTLIGLRDFAVINTMLRVGLRSIEIVRAKISDIRPVSSESIGLWVHGKAREEADEYLVMTEDCLRPIMDYITARGPLKQDAPLFASLSDGSYGSGLSTCTIRRVVKERLRAVGISSPRISGHSLRHSCLTLAIEGGASIQDVQKLGRHADISTTNGYLHMRDRASGRGERSVENILKK